MNTFASIRLAGLLLSTAALAACGGSSSDADAGALDALVADSAVVVDAASADAPLPDARPVLPPGLIAPRPYLSMADSPFVPLGLTVFHLEDFEDDALNTPGVTADTLTLSSSFGDALVDSVDGDDGVVDDTCAGGCNSLFGGGSIEFTFDADALGGLPTHVGGVWTDGGSGCGISFEAFDGDDVSLGVTSADAIGDGSNLGTVEEDRFMGIVAPGGVGRVVFANTSGGTEVDHLQYGR